MSLILPPATQAEFEVERHARAGKALDRALRDLDQHLSFVWVKELPEEQLPLGCIGGRWHVRNTLPQEHGQRQPHYMPIVGQDGSYREPDFGILTELQRQDMWKEGALNEALRDHVRERKRKAMALKDEQLGDDMRADFRAAKRVAGEGGLRRKKWAKGLAGS